MSNIISVEALEEVWWVITMSPWPDYQKGDACSFIILSLLAPPLSRKERFAAFFGCCRFFENYLIQRFKQFALPGNIYLHILATRASVRSRQYTWMVF